MSNAHPALATRAPESDVSIARLDDALAVLDEVRTAMRHRGATYGLDMPWGTFIRHMRLLNPQAYGSRLQKWLAHHYGWTEVPASLDRGDVQVGKAYQEVKVTLLQEEGGTVHFVQIRPWQRIDGYRCFVVQRDNSVVQFYLTKAQMRRELQDCGTTAHGVAERAAAAEAGGSKEWKIKFPFKPGHRVYDRWMANYWIDVPGPR